MTSSSWPDRESTGRALHRHRRGQGSSPVQARIFQAYLSLLLKLRSKTAKIINIKMASIRSSNEILADLLLGLTGHLVTFIKMELAFNYVHFWS